MIVMSFLNIAFALNERLENPVQGKKPAYTPAEQGALRECKKHLGLFHYALDVLAAIPIDGIDKTIISNLSSAFKGKLEFIIQTKKVTDQLAVIPVDDQAKRNRFVDLAIKAINSFQFSCSASTETMRLVNLAQNTTSKKVFGISVTNPGAYGIKEFVEAATYYLSIMNPSASTGGTPSAGQQVAKDLQKRLDAMRGIKPLPLGPSGKPMTGPEVAKYLAAKLDELRRQGGGSRRKTIRRRKSHRRHRRSVRR